MKTRMISLLAAACALAGSQLFAGTSVFEQEILAKKAVPHPSNPYVIIFFDGGNDGEVYGSRTGGKMGVQDWEAVFKHVGHLSPYSVFGPNDEIRWRKHGRGIPLAAAANVGRETGGCVMGLPDTPKAVANVQAAYADEFGSRMKYYFHDFEPYYGLAGGAGAMALQMDCDTPAALETAVSPDFDFGDGKPMESFTIAFDINLENCIYGGHSYLLGFPNDCFVAVNNPRTDLKVAPTQIVITGANMSSVASAPIAYRDGQGKWQHVEIKVDGSDKTDTMDVAIVLNDALTTRGQLKRPKAGAHPLSLGTLHNFIYVKDRKPVLDNIMVTGSVNGAKRLLAHYEFEPAGNPKDGAPVAVADDSSGNGHALKLVGPPGAFTLKRASGLDDKMFASMKLRLVDDLLASRRAKNLPPPDMITNWVLAGAPKRFATWKGAGFTHASTENYLNGDVKPSFANLGQVLKDEQKVWMRQEGARDIHTWLGVIGSKVVPTPEQWQDIVVLSVLDNVRYFSVFVSMSNGHLGPQAWTAEKDAAAMAKTNADALHAMAAAASWFQPCAALLANAEPTPVAGLPRDFDGIAKMKLDAKSKEAVFAVFTSGAPRQVAVKTPALAGVVTNLKTGQAQTVNNGEFMFEASGVATPYHFKPAI